MPLMRGITGKHFTGSVSWIDGRPDQLEVGQAYEVNNQKQHSVANTSVEERITFIFDTIPPGPLAYPSGQGRQRPA